VNGTYRTNGNCSLAAVIKVAVFSLVFITTTISAFPVFADMPLKQLESNVAELTTILDDKEYRETHTKDDLKKKLIKTAQVRFDWEGIAQKSLGLYWRDRTCEEKKEFTLLLKDLLISSYLDKIIDNYSGERILYDKEVVKGKRAFIEFRIINKAETSISLGARMHDVGGQWMIYDLVIEGVSSVKNYRVQFYDIIRQSSYNDLVVKLREKVNNLKKQAE
jgi:phospholipid transport system substrate-binding protein